MVNIFVYGTLRPDQSGYEWVLKQKTLEIKQSLGYLLDFGLYELEGLPLISPSPGSKVHGYVLELTSTLTSDEMILSQFDEYEGIKNPPTGKPPPTAYKRQLVCIEVGEKRINAHAYVAKKYEVRDQKLDISSVARLISSGTWQMNEDPVFRDHLPSVLNHQRELEAEKAKIDKGLEDRRRLEKTQHDFPQTELSNLFVRFLGNYLVLFTIFERYLKYSEPYKTTFGMIKELERDLNLSSLRQSASKSGHGTEINELKVFGVTGKGIRSRSLRETPFYFCNVIRNNAMHQSKMFTIRNLDLVISATNTLQYALPRLIIGEGRTKAAHTIEQSKIQTDLRRHWKSKGLVLN